MTTLQRLVWRIVLGLVLIFGGGWMLGGVVNLAALASPQLVSKMECPAGSTAQQSLQQLSFNEPGQKTLTFSCVDQAGNPVAPLSDAQTKAAEFRLFYPVGVILMTVAVTAWSIASALRRRRSGLTSAA